MATFSIKLVNSISESVSECSSDQPTNTYGRLLLDFDCEQAVGDQIWISNVTPGASLMIISKVGIFGSEDIQCNTRAGTAFSIPDMTVTVQGTPETYTFSASTDNCGQATYTLLEEVPFISIFYEDTTNSVTIKVAPISNLDKGTY